MILVLPYGRLWLGYLELNSVLRQVSAAVLIYVSLRIARCQVCVDGLAQIVVRERDGRDKVHLATIDRDIRAAGAHFPFLALWAFAVSVRRNISIRHAAMASQRNCGESCEIGHIGPPDSILG